MGAPLQILSNCSRVSYKTAISSDARQGRERLQSLLQRLRKTPRYLFIQIRRLTIKPAHIRPTA